MLLRAHPVKLGQQVLVHAGRRHADVVQHAQLEQKMLLRQPQAQHAATFGGHHAHPLAVGQVVHPDQIQGVGEGVNHMVQFGLQGHKLGGWAGGEQSAGAHARWQCYQPLSKPGSAAMSAMMCWAPAPRSASGVPWPMGLGL